MSTIQRQFSLPNCVLLLEGFSDLEGTSLDGARQSLTILTRCECHFANQPQSLIGGRDFLEGLIQATHACAQAWMSGIPVKASSQSKGEPRVQLQPQAEGQFQLQVPSQLLHQTAAAVDSAGERVTLTLSTVQLFDLMEAIDQVLTDAGTLPDLSLKVRPRLRREARSGSETVAKSAPLALGTASLVVAAAALFWLPVPETRKPPEDEPLPSPPTETQPLVPPTPPTPDGNGN